MQHDPLIYEFTFISITSIKPVHTFSRLNYFLTFIYFFIDKKIIYRVSCKIKKMCVGVNHNLRLEIAIALHSKLRCFRRFVWLFP